MKLRRLLQFTGIATLVLTILWMGAGLVFRARYYDAMPVPAGQAYGGADVLELGHYAVLLCLSGLLAVEGALLVLIRRLDLWRLGVAQMVAAPSVVFGYLELHRIVAAAL